jgi:Sec-independent protein translocase protein TatA
VDSLTPLHIILIAAIITVVLGPERAGRVVGQIVNWLRTYRQLSGNLTPTGMAETLFRAALPPPSNNDSGGPGTTPR